jgi:hypothetical protein
VGLPDEDKPIGYRYKNGQLKADFEIIRTLATSRGSWWTEKATDSHGKVTRTTLTAESFSGIDSCKEFGTVYAAAKTIYEETLKGIQQDVKDYQDKLLQVAKHLEDKDNQAEQVFAGLAAPAEPTVLHGDKRNDEANKTEEAEEAEQTQEAAQKDAAAGTPTGEAPTGDGSGDPAPDTSGDDVVDPGATETDEGQTQVKASR